MIRAGKYLIPIIYFVSLTGTGEAQNPVYRDAPKVTPGTTEAMQTPEFWINNLKGNPDKVIMTPEQIENLNKKNQTKMYEFTDINGKKVTFKKKDSILVIDPLSLRSFSGEEIRARLNRDRDFLESTTFYDFRKRTWDEDMRNEIYEQMDVGSLPGTITPRYGIITSYVNNRRFPTHKKAWTEQNGWLNQFGTVALNAGMPAAILHTTKNKDWYYVRSEISIGWIPSVSIAVGSKNELRHLTEAKDFFVVTCHRVPVYSDNDWNNFMTYLYMGGEAKLLGKTEKGYNVLLPFRQADGSFETAQGWIRPDACVSVGYQPFNRRNIINTAFSVLYRPWASGDSYNEESCSGYARSVLRTFGIITVKSTVFGLTASDHVTIFPRETSREVKYKFLDKCEPGTTLLGSSEHIIFYLGKVNGKYYVIHRTGYDYPGDDGTMMMVRRVNVNDTELPGGSHVDTWTHICEIEP